MKKLKAFQYRLVILLREKYLIPVCRKNRFLSDLYYLLFSNDFSREHQKVLNGKYIHIQARKEDKPNAYHLRREVHRLEKGLIMKNRKAVFGIDYIQDVVNNYIILKKEFHQGTTHLDAELLNWSFSVLEQYFSTVTNNAVVLKAKEAFNSFNAEIPVSPNQKRMVPYHRREQIKSNVTFDNLFDLAVQRRSVRWYQEKDVSKELIEKAVSVATLSPSACNRQPFRFRIFTEKEKKNVIGSIPMGIKGYFDNIPCFAVIVGQLSAYPSERDRHVIYLDGGLAAMAFMFALETLGLSSVPINWPDIEQQEKKMDEALNLQADERPLLVIGFGYADPDGMIPYSQKKTPASLIEYN